jgi:hypothetical protein
MVAVVRRVVVQQRDDADGRSSAAGMPDQPPEEPVDRGVSVLPAVPRLKYFEPRIQADEHVACAHLPDL